MKVPVLFIIFNRPEIAIKTFAAIRAYQPNKLYIVADGPRSNIKREDSVCKETRRLILEQIDWPCELKTIFRSENIGCARGVSEAITWMFTQEEYGIILEDDCLPSPDFFQFCEELLPLYKDNNDIAQINGFNNRTNIPESNTYTFSSYVGIWGWATWARAWQHMDLEMREWPILRKNIFNRFTPIEALLHLYFWSNVYKSIQKKHHLNTWGYQWSIHVFMTHKICIEPYANMIINTGIGKNGTNCKSSNNLLIPSFYGQQLFPLIHPKKIALNSKEEKIRSKKYIQHQINILFNKITKTLS